MNLINRLFRKQITTNQLIDFLIKNKINFDYSNEQLTIWRSNFKTPYVFICLIEKQAKYFGINIEAKSDYKTIISQLKKTI